ncbi:5'-adenylylsulfate reductase-like 3 [Apostasia shenzhenica]|uniref:5'-adenylylsulfate reductase-like 3 n=1 Tax=Apostasia shenzhenica TaxID=1088818 RepID=A0A2I0ACA2_9ASPA|nr:5'-adenylylsulfate reductase-like 3 [Apostasia shenzhenica]
MIMRTTREAERGRAGRLYSVISAETHLRRNEWREPPELEDPELTLPESVMEARIWRLVLALALVFCGLVPANGDTREICRRLLVGEVILGPSDTCSSFDVPANDGGLQGVVELQASASGLHLNRNPVVLIDGDEIALQRAVNIAQKNREQYVAVLFYASWCPFSKICRSNFNKMSSMFPSIPHFSFEESFIRPSILSRYGVHGFPTLFLLNSTMRVRYHGSRSINSLVTFYSDITGVKSTPVDPATTDKALVITNLAKDTGDPKQENCPFSWARSPENLLQQESYLALASCFLLSRLLYFLLPRLGSFAKRAWRWQIHLPTIVSLFQQAKRGFGKLNPYKGTVNAKAWASKSLASVSIGEPSSRSCQIFSERR